MDFGIASPNYPGCWDDAAFAEEHGFTTVGFFDSPLIGGDPFVSMALTAQRTFRMRVGTQINVPTMRQAPVTASALSAINHMAPGRVFFGTGTGFTGRLTHNLPAVKISTVRDRVQEVRDLVHGRDVVHREDGRESPIRFVNDEYLRTNENHPIPFYMAADGPKAMKATGALADGWIATVAIHGGNTMGNAPDVFASQLATIKDSATRHGRNFDDAYTMWTTQICILEPGESVVSPRVLAQTGPMAMFAFHTYACNPAVGEFLPPYVQERIATYESEVLARLNVPRERFYQEVHAGHLTHLLDGEAAVLTEEIIKSISLTGTVEEIAEQLHRMERNGLKNVSVTIPPAHFKDVVLDVETKLMPLLDKATI